MANVDYQQFLVFPESHDQHKLTFSARHATSGRRQQRSGEHAKSCENEIDIVRNVDKFDF